MGSLVSGSVCCYSIVRYVADPLRDEPRNIGVIVVSESGTAQGRFALGRTGLPASAPRQRLLRSMLEGYELHMRTGPQLKLEDAFGKFGYDRLVKLSRESTNLLQFTEPMASEESPDQTLRHAFDDFVAPRRPSGTSWSRGAAVRTFQREFAKKGLAYLIQGPATYKVNAEPPFVFDLGIRNGRWYALIESASFQLQDLQRPEERVAWLAFAWQSIQEQKEAPRELLMLVERQPGLEEAEQRFQRLSVWGRQAGIKVYDAEDAPRVAKELATKLSNGGNERDAFDISRVD